MRLAILVVSLIAALGLAVWSSQVPAPRGLDSPTDTFSSARAMVDIRQISRAPHPVGSAEHSRVRLYLIERMNQLGLSPTEQVGPLSPLAIQRLTKSGGTPEAANNMATNLVGLLPGKDGTKPPVLIMAHYDTAVGSPGAADDSTGVAASLEIIRAIKTRGPAERDIILLLTDAEEIGLDGARLFFSEHPWRDRVGAVINLEARGGGGRAAMFETGRNNGQTIAAFAPVVGKADGGTTSTSLAVFMYEQMPNGTDFTISKDRGIGGMNFAFIGRPGQYHSAESTPENLDEGSVQHIGSQALEASDTLARANALPNDTTASAVYADIFGRFLISHPPVMGWVILGLTALFGGLAFWRERKGVGLGYRSVLLGAVDGIWLLTAGAVLTQAIRLLAGPMASRATSAQTYYVLLERLPWMEIGAGLTILALVLTLLSGARHRYPRTTAITIAVVTVLSLIIGGFSPVILGLGIVSTALSLWPLRRVPSIWGAWLGLILLVSLLGLVLQILAPQAALILTWPALVAAGVAVVTAFVLPDLDRPKALILPAIAAILVSGWLLGLAHLTFLGIGMDMPGVMALFGLLIALFLRPLSPAPGQMRKVVLTAGLCLLLACGFNLSARWFEPTPSVALNTP